MSSTFLNWLTVLYRPISTQNVPTSLFQEFRKIFLIDCLNTLLYHTGSHLKDGINLSCQGTSRSGLKLVEMNPILKSCQSNFLEGKSKKSQGTSLHKQIAVTKVE